jgi:ApbE superfamily uncharacterized protein (UPF0280 family)
MTIDWLATNSGGNGGTAVTFTNVGDKVVGTIAAEPRPKETQFGERLIVELVAGEGSTATADGNPINPGDAVTVFVKPGAMAAAIRTALVEAGAAGLREGDTLALAFSENRDTGKPSPLKVFQARYTAAKPAVSVDSLV